MDASFGRYRLDQRRVDAELAEVLD